MKKIYNALTAANNSLINICFKRKDVMYMYINFTHYI